MPRTAYLDKPTPNIQTTVVDGTVHKFAFSFADFLKIWLKFWGRNLATDSHTRTHKGREGERASERAGKRKKAFWSLGVRLGDPHSQTYTHGVVRK